jgi:fimbrial chaperone protein
VSQLGYLTLSYFDFEDVVMKSVWRSAFLALFLVLLGSVPTLAFKLLPISRTFTPSGAKATQSYEVINDTQERVAVIMSIGERQVSLVGQETLKPADDDFIVYPPQILLGPNQKQTVRITWIGDPNPAKELSYRLIAEQLPIELVEPETQSKHPTGQIRVLMKYAGSLYIRPENAQADVVLDTVEAIKDAQGTEQLVVTFHNQGTAHLHLKQLRLHLQTQGKTITLQAKQLGEMDGANILPGAKRRFVIPRPAELPSGAVQATFEINK